MSASVMPSWTASKAVLVAPSTQGSQDSENSNERMPPQTMSGTTTQSASAPNLPSAVANFNVSNGSPR
jgi:hypothetical protein